MSSHLLALAALAAMTAAWVAVQLAWRRAFPAGAEDEDALAGRLGCQGCHCEEPPEGCARSDAAEEDRS